MNRAIRFARWVYSQVEILLFLSSRLIKRPFSPAAAARQVGWGKKANLTRSEKEDSGKDDYTWAARYRRVAHEARQRATTVRGDNTRQVLLHLAASYDELAAEIEQRVATRNSC